MRFVKSIEAVAQHYPIELVADPCVILGRHAGGVVQTASCDINLISRIFVLEGQLRSTTGTEASHCVWGRSELGRCSIDKAEFRARHSEPSNEGGAGGTTANRAVAICPMRWISAGFETDSATITTTC